MKPRLVLALLLAATASCAPRIHHFELSPALVCAGDPPSTGSWNARGDLSLQVSTSEQESSDPAVRERLQQLPPGTRLVMLRLVASRAGEERDVETRWIEQLPERFETEVVFPASPEPGGLVAAGAKNPARWGDRFEIATVAALDGRTLLVRHAGQATEVGAAPSIALAGTALEGPWELRWRSDGGTPPEVLRVSVVARCRRGS
jgi:hypothetical protein